MSEKHSHHTQIISDSYNTAQLMIPRLMASCQLLSNPLIKKFLSPDDIRVSAGVEYHCSWQVKECSCFLTVSQTVCLQLDNQTGI